MLALSGEVAQLDRSPAQPVLGPPAGHRLSLRRIACARGHESGIGPGLCLSVERLKGKIEKLKEEIVRLKPFASFRRRALSRSLSEKSRHRTAADQRNMT